MESVKIQAILDLKNEEFEHEMDESEWKKKHAPEKKKKTTTRLTFPLLSEFGTQEGYSKGGKNQARNNQVGGNLQRKSLQPR